MSTHVFSLCLPPCPNVSPTWSSTLFPSQARAVSRLRTLEKPWNLASQWSSSCLPQPGMSYICLPDVFDLSSTCCVRVVSQLSSDVISQVLPPTCLQGFSTCCLVVLHLSPSCLPDVVSQLSLRCGLPIASQVSSTCPPQRQVVSQRWAPNNSQLL